MLANSSSGGVALPQAPTATSAVCSLGEVHSSMAPSLLQVSARASSHTPVSTGEGNGISVCSPNLT